MGGRAVVPRRFDVMLVSLDPTLGHEIQKTRPCVVVSPDEVNAEVQTCVVVPLTTGRAWPWRPATLFESQKGCLAVDQIRCVDRARLVRRLGALDAQAQDALLAALGAFFVR